MYMYPAILTQKYIKLGTNIFEKNWDTLIILDACRTDAIKKVAPEYDFIESVDSIWSVGSTSKEWYVHTFQSRDVTDVSLVSGNGWIKHLFETEPDWKYWTATRNSIWHSISALDAPLQRPLPASEDFYSYVPVVGDHGADLGTTPLPDEITDAAIHEHRTTAPKKMIIHYMQPHEPYVQKQNDGKLPDMHAHPLDSLKAGNASRKEVYSAYLENLREALNSVSKLLKNIDSERVAITADHGELFGEWNGYAHPAAFPHPAVRKVPWIITHASNIANEEVDPPQQIEASAKERLSDLGYL